MPALVYIKRSFFVTAPFSTPHHVRLSLRRARLYAP
jgi:hypothetical protein